MNNSFVYGFILGSCIGTTAAFIFAKHHYRKLAEKEINDIAKRSSNIRPDSTNVDPPAENVELPKEPIDDIIAAEAARESYSPTPELEPGVEDLRVITNEQFSSNLSYRSVSLYYWDDNVLADADDEKVDGLSNVCKLASEYFKDSDNWVMYIRNAPLGIDYEINRTDERFEDYGKDLSDE